MLLYTIVDIVEPKTPHPEPVIAPTTSTEQNRVTAGQRETSLLWEKTQRNLAYGVTGTCLLMYLFEIEVPPALALLNGIIVTFYYQRTNHTKIGGVGGTNDRSIPDNDHR